VIAAQAVHAALRWIGQNISSRQAWRIFSAIFFGLGKWLARVFVLDELHAERAGRGLSHRRRGDATKRRKRVAQVLSCRNDAIEKFLRFEIIEDGVSRSSANRMRLVGEAVHEGARAAFERFDNARGNEYRAQRRVTTRDSLPH